MPSNIPREQPFFSFVLFSTVLVKFFIKNPKSSNYLIIFLRFSISSFDTTNVTISKAEVPDPRTFYEFLHSLLILLLLMLMVSQYSRPMAWVHFTLMENQLSLMLEKVTTKSKFCIIWDMWLLDNFIRADELFPKALQGLASCLSFNNKFFGKLVPLLSITFW